MQVSTVMAWTGSSLMMVSDDDRLVCSYNDGNTGFWLTGPPRCRGLQSSFNLNLFLYVLSGIDG